MSDMITLSDGTVLPPIQLEPLVIYFKFVPGGYMLKDIGDPTQIKFFNHLYFPLKGEAALETTVINDSDFSFLNLLAQRQGWYFLIKP